MCYSIGSAPINLELNQTDIDMITVSWTPPPAPPSNGYRITVDSEDFSAGIDTMSSSQDISVSPRPGLVCVCSLVPYTSLGRLQQLRDITVLGIITRKEYIIEYLRQFWVSKGSLTL